MLLADDPSLMFLAGRVGGQGSHQSPAVALARPADPALCHEGPLTETCQLFSYLKRDKVMLVMITRLARITSEPGIET